MYGGGCSVLVGVASTSATHCQSIACGNEAAVCLVQCIIELIHV